MKSSQQYRLKNTRRIRILTPQIAELCSRTIWNKLCYDAAWRHYKQLLQENVTLLLFKLRIDIILSDGLAAPSLLSTPDSTTLTYNIGLYRTEGNNAVAITTPRCLFPSATLQRFEYLSFTLWLTVLPRTNIAWLISKQFLWYITSNQHI
jgi:hypothetical protein